MKSAHLFALICAVLILLGVSGLLNAGSPVGIIDWPSEAFLGIAFTFGWLTGAPAWLAYLFAIFTVAIVAIIGYLLGLRLWRVLAKNGG